MPSPKKKKKLIAKSKTALAPGKAIIYLHGDKADKKWLQETARKLEKKQGGKVSISTLATRIFRKAKRDYKSI